MSVRNVRRARSRPSLAAFEFPRSRTRRSRRRPLRSNSRDVPDRDRAADVAAADGCWQRDQWPRRFARELDRHAFTDVAEAILGMQRQRVSGDYLQTSAIIGPTGAVHAAVNDPNRYSGPGTGYRLDGERWERLQHLPHELRRAHVGRSDAGSNRP